jgi:DNA-binding response OmpR family regulator
VTRQPPAREPQLVDFDLWSDDEGQSERLPSETASITHTLVIDFGRSQAFDGDQPLGLTYREFRLLRCLVENAGIALDRDRLAALELSWHQITNPRTIDTQIRRLRLKLGAYGEIIRTKRRVGYCYEPHPDVIVVDHSLRTHR